MAIRPVNTANTADTPDTADTANTADTPDTPDTANEIVNFKQIKSTIQRAIYGFTTEIRIVDSRLACCGGAKGTEIVYWLLNR